MSYRSYGGNSRYNNSYNNNYSRSNYGNSGGGYRRGGRSQKKHSGCKAGVDRNGNPYVRGWNYSRRNGLVTYYCSPYKNTSEHESQSGRMWHNWMVRIQKNGQKQQLASCLYDPQKRMVTISEVGFVLNPQTNYCGHFGRGRN